MMNVDETLPTDLRFFYFQFFCLSACPYLFFLSVCLSVSSQRVLHTFSLIETNICIFKFMIRCICPDGKKVKELFFSSFNTIQRNQNIILRLKVFFVCKS